MDFKDIETICFYYEPSFNWPQDEISSAAEETPTVWCCVHLDREQFASLLTGMGYSVRPSSDDVQAKLSIYKTGLAGRPSAMHLILPMAEARLDAGDCPRTKTELARQLVDQYKKEHPQGPRGVTVKTIPAKLRNFRSFGAKRAQNNRQLQILGAFIGRLRIATLPHVAGR